MTGNLPSSSGRSPSPGSPAARLEGEGSAPGWVVACAGATRPADKPGALASGRLVVDEGGRRRGRGFAGEGELGGAGEQSGGGGEGVEGGQGGGGVAGDQDGGGQREGYGGEDLVGRRDG